MRNAVHSYVIGGSGRDGVICVLGAHRSGTSAATRVLNLLGVYLGAEGDLIQPRAGDNPKGFWEHSGIVHTNERILWRLGARAGCVGQLWRDPPRPRDGWERSPALRPIAWRASLMLRMHFGRSPLWGWKDPRTSLTLPFWQQLVPQMRYVICVRNPDHAVASLGKRSTITLEQGYELWLRYMTAALTHTAGRPRMIVEYESLMEQTQTEVDRLAAFIGRPERARDRAVRAAIARHLDRALWDRRGVAAADRERPMPRAVWDLYRALRADGRGLPDVTETGG